MTRLLAAFCFLLAVPMLLVTLLLVVDLGRFKEHFEPALSEAMGRELDFEGPLHIDVGRTIELSAQRVSLANPDWAVDPHMIEADSIQFEVDTLSLLSGLVVVREVLIVGASVDLEERGDGSANWLFADMESDTEVDSEIGGEGGSLPVRVERLSIVDSRIEYSGPMLEVPAVLELSSVEEALTTDMGLELRIDGALNAEPVDLMVQVDDVRALEALGAIAVTVDGSVGQIKLDAEGSIENLAELTAPRGEFSLQGPSFRYLADLLKLRTESDGPLSVTGKVAVVEGNYNLSIRGNLATIELEAEAMAPGFGALQGVELSTRLQGDGFVGFEHLLGLPDGAPGPFSAQLQLAPSGADQTELDARLLVAGATLDVRGTLQELSSSLRGSSIDVRVSGASLAESAAAAGEIIPIDGPYSLASTITVVSGGYELSDIVAALGENRVGASAALAPDGDNWKLSAPFNAELADVAALIPPSEDPMELPPALRALTLNGFLQLDPEILAIDTLEVKHALMKIEVGGRISVTDPMNEPQVSIRAEGESLAAVVEDLPPQLDSAFRITGDLGLDKQGRAEAALMLLGEHLEVRTEGVADIRSDALPVELQLTSNVAGSDLAGELRFENLDVPEITLDLHSKMIDLRPWEVTEGSSVGAAAKPVQAAEPDAGDDGRLISDMDLSEFALPSLNADFALRADRIETTLEHVEAFELTGSLTPDVLHVKQLAFRGAHGGDVIASLGMDDHGSELEPWLRITAENVSVGLPAQDPEEAAALPRYDAKLAVTGHGRSLRQIAASSHGYLALVGGEGKVDTGAMSIFANDFMAELLDSVNPFAKKDKYSNIRCSLVLASLENGRVTGDPILVIENDRLRIFADADIDLGTESLDADFNTVPMKGLGIGLTNLINPYVKVSGTLANPALGLDSSSALVSGGAALATGGVSILAKGLFDRVTAEEDVCASALRSANEEFDRLESMYGSGKSGAAES